MLSLDCIVQPQIDPLSSVATDRYLMQRLEADRDAQVGFLRISAMAGDLLCLGRYHFAPDGPSRGPVTVCRRQSGGRVLPGGDGFARVSLILPHRSALVADEPLALRAEQVLNRCVRGVLEACRRLGLAVIYPGRDLVTINRRICAAISFETDMRGVLLFEACIAVERDFGVVPAFLDAADPGGTVKAEVLTPDRVTCLAAEVGRAPSFEELQALMCDGYARQGGLRIQPRELDAVEREAIAAIGTRDLAPERWLRARHRRAELDRHVLSWAQLGALEAHLALDRGPTIREIVFGGDFIANSAAIESLERELRSCPIDRDAINAVVTRIFSRPENYWLGIGPLDTVADMIVRGLA